MVAKFKIKSILFKDIFIYIFVVPGQHIALHLDSLFEQV